MLTSVPRGFKCMLLLVLAQNRACKQRLAAAHYRTPRCAGIALDGRGKRLFVTGKWWHQVYQVQLSEAPQASLQATRTLCIPRGGPLFI